MTWRQRVLAGVLEWERRYPHLSGFLAIHTAEFYDGLSPSCVRAIRQLIDQQYLLKKDDEDLMVGVRTNPDKLKEILAEIREREWYQDPKFIIPAMIALAGTIGGLVRFLFFSN